MWVIECHGVIGPGYYSDPRYNGYPVREFFRSRGVRFCVPAIDPWDGVDAVRAAYDRLSPRFGVPWLTGQCVGGLTALGFLARFPGLARGALLLNPVSDVSAMHPQYADGAARAASFDILAITDPVHIWHGTDDLTSPYSCSAALPFSLHTVEGGFHHRLTASAYVGGLSRFF